ncbi:MAG: hypothetical protein QM817_31350 [Archangium sp.]
MLRDGGTVLAQTDAEGHFELTTETSNADGGLTLELLVRASGFRPLEVTETLAPRQRVEVRYRLERAVEGWETVVRARRDEGPSRIELSRVELQEIAGTMGDPFRVAMLLPGVSSIASGLSYPVVRGAQPAATGFFVDGVKVPQLYHLLAGPAWCTPTSSRRSISSPACCPRDSAGSSVEPSTAASQNHHRSCRSPRASTCSTRARSSRCPSSH